jgi:molecular chaperone DnaJ
LRDPYEVLEINKGASREEIQKAYRRLVKKYHPDQYRDNPLAKLAEEKLTEINEAYDYLMKNGSAGSGSTYSGSGYGGGNAYDSNDQSWDQSRESADSDSFFNQVRIHINSGNLGAAEQMLDRSGVRTAQWFFLKGIIFQRKGWYSQALSNLQTAVSMEPGNPEYQNALNTMNYNNTTYRERSGGYTGRDTDWCNICQCMICTDCCCECFGGDFIPCC